MRDIGIYQAYSKDTETRIKFRTRWLLAINITAWASLRATDLRLCLQKGATILIKKQWCPGEDSNLHGFHHWYLKPARLPIPPPGHHAVS